MRAEGVSLEEAQVNLCMAICAWNGDGEALLVFDPPLPSANTTPLEDCFTLNFNEGVRTKDKIKDLYVGGICPLCQHGIGLRNKRSLNLEKTPKSDVLGTLGLRPKSFVYSESLLSLFSTAETKRINFREVEFPGKSRNRYYELIGPALVEQVGIFGGEYLTDFHQSWACKRCQRKEFCLAPSQPGELIDGYIVRSDLPEKLPSVFTFKSRLGCELVFNRAMWAKILASKFLKGFAEGRVKLINEKLADRDPKLPQPSKFEW